MSWIATKKVRPLLRHSKRAQAFRTPALKKYICFNIFTKDGENKTCVKTPHPMTLEEAQVYFDALCIGAEY